MTIETIYDVDGGWVIHGDCVEVMDTLRDDYVDAIVTDPPYGIAILGREWDSFEGPEAFERWTERWAREAMRVLKPGGHAVVFCGDRVYQRMACGVEDAGFEVRHLIAWIRSDNFPKGMNVAQSIEQRVLGKKDRRKADLTTPEAQEWDGWNTTLKIAIEPILLARKPLSEKTLIDNVMEHGTGAINIDAIRLVSEPRVSRTVEPSARTDTVHGNAQIPRRRRLELSVKFEYNGSLGRWPPSVALECICDDDHLDINEHGVLTHGDPTCPCAQLDVQGGGDHVGVVGMQAINEGTKSDLGWNNRILTDKGIRDSGGVSRFFYCAKASAKERAGSKHVSVKPLALMRWLVRLITPPGGIVLDPFMGSGTTLVAAKQHGFRFIGIDVEGASVADAIRRLETQGEEVHPIPKMKQ